MSVTTAYDRQPTLTRVFESLTDPRRRETLVTVLADDQTLSESALASSIADGDCQGVDTSDPETVREALRHVHLPKLATADLITWDRSAATVTPGDHPIVENPRFRSLLEAGEKRWAVATAVHSDDCRRSVVEALAEGAGETTREALAEAIAAAGNESVPTAERLTVQLHHVHLPKLQSVDLLSYDQAQGTVVPEGDLDVPLLDVPASAD